MLIPLKDLKSEARGGIQQKQERTSLKNKREERRPNVKVKKTATKQEHKTRHAIRRHHFTCRETWRSWLWFRWYYFSCCWWRRSSSHVALLVIVFRVLFQSLLFSAHFTLWWWLLQYNFFLSSSASWSFILILNKHIADRTLPRSRSRISISSSSTESYSLWSLPKGIRFSDSFLCSQHPPWFLRSDFMFLLSISPVVV